MSSYTFNETERGAIQAFLEHLVYIKSVRNTFAALYEEPSSVYVLSNTANDFFGYLNGILINYLNLAYARILDPFDEKHPNFGIDYLYGLKEWLQPEKDELDTLRNKLADFRKYVKKPRNKVIAHNDVKTYLRKHAPIGGFPEGEDLRFIANAEAFLTIIYRNAFGSIFGDIVTTNPGDAIDLLRYLRMGLAVDRMVAEKAKGDDFSNLFLYMEKVETEARNLKPSQ
jgi:hypothetical protein